MEQEPTRQPRKAPAGAPPMERPKGVLPGRSQGAREEAPLERTPGSSKGVLPGQSQQAREEAPPMERSPCSSGVLP